MELKELQEKFLEYAKANPIYDVVDDFENDIAFDGDEPLFEVERVISVDGGRLFFNLRRQFIVSADEEDELDVWMRNFVQYVGIKDPIPMQHEIQNDNGADYDVEIFCHLT